MRCATCVVAVNNTNDVAVELFCPVTCRNSSGGFFVSIAAISEFRQVLILHSKERQRRVLSRDDIIVYIFAFCTHFCPKIQQLAVFRRSC